MANYIWVQLTDAEYGLLNDRLDEFEREFKKLGELRLATRVNLTKHLVNQRVWELSGYFQMKKDRR